MTVAEILRSLPKRQREDAVWLLMALRQCGRSSLMLAAAEPLSPELVRAWRKAWARRRRGEPLQYIVGSAPFWGREFSVRPGVLVPRPETEVLVELVLKLFPAERRVRALDICTGSGAIALTLKLERPGWLVRGTDLSARALAVAKENARRFGADVSWGKGNLFLRADRRERWDVVVANPPYLDLGKDRVTEEVRNWEPRMALEPGKESRSREVKERAAWCAERILAACEENRPSFTALELSPRVARLLESRWRARRSVLQVWRAPDLAGKNRFLLVAWKPHG